jgi:peptide/nickel transport system permease protein
MLGYLTRRVLMAVPSLLLVSVAVFALVRLIPGDPVQVMLGDAGTAEQVAEMRHALGLDATLPVQFAAWLGRALHGDLGRSLVNQLPVLPLVLARASVSAAVVLAAIAVAVLIAVPLGLLAAWRQGRALDHAVVVGVTLLLSVPSFWLGLLLLTLFGVRLGWLPVVGYVGFTEDPGAALSFLVLPVATLALVECGGLLRMARASALDVLRLDYVTHARAKGVPEWRVLLRHVLPTSFGPTWTLIGLTLGHLLGGVAVLETVFTLPGLGRLMVDSIFARDYPVVQGCLLFAAIAFVLVNLIVDLCAPLFDPRIAAE